MCVVVHLSFGSWPKSKLQEHQGHTIAVGLENSDQKGGSPILYTSKVTLLLLCNAIHAWLHQQRYHTDFLSSFSGILVYTN